MESILPWMHLLYHGNDCCFQYSMSRMAEDMIDFAAQLGPDLYPDRTVFTEEEIPYPEMLEWVVTDEVQSMFAKAQETWDALKRDLDLKVLFYTDYGSAFVKKCGLRYSLVEMHLMSLQSRCLRPDGTTISVLQTRKEAMCHL